MIYIFFLFDIVTHKCYVGFLFFMVYDKYWSLVCHSNCSSPIINASGQLSNFQG